MRSIMDEYTEIEHFEVKVEEKEIGVKYWKRMNYGNHSLRNKLIPCNAKLCEGGGISITKELHDMVKNRQNEMKMSEPCHGYSKDGTKCTTQFKVTILMKFKEK